VNQIDNIMELADQYMGWGAASDRQALRAAIEAALKMEHLNYLGCMEDLKEAEKALKPGEPVAWQVHPFDYGIGHKGVYATTHLPQQRDAWVRKGWVVQPLYITPQPQREWVGLTETDLANCDTDEYETARRWERLLRQKNGGGV
jgi:hypothetical protein